MIKSYDISSEFYELDIENVVDVVLSRAVGDGYINESEKEHYEVRFVENLSN